MVRGKTDRVKELGVIADVYNNTFKDSLATPVPKLFLKQHLDLINSYNALRVDITAMSQVYNDPATTLVRFKRYRDDSLGLRLSLENMLTTLTPYENLFNETDSAVFFANFDTKQNRVY
jgi:hypothetical protein